MKGQLKYGVFLAALLVSVCSLYACRSAGQSPEDIADAFVTAYYVDADLDQALNYCDGLACQKLRNELTLRDGQEITADTFHPQITAKRTQVLEEADGAKRFVYTFVVKPEGVAPFERQAYVKLRQDNAGTWKVSQFVEIQMTPPQQP